MANQPLFSIIIPTYNRADLLRVAIQSVFDQTVEDWEIVVVDDGSTDETKEVVRFFDPTKVQYNFQDNKERSAARNIGVQKAKGQYICFLDDDDYFLVEHLEVIKERILKEGSPVGIFRTGMVTKHGTKEIKSPFYDPIKDKHPIPFFLNNMVGIHTLCYHRNIFEIYKYDQRWHHFQDTHLLILCLLKFPFFQIPVHTAIYMRYPEMGSISIFRLENSEARTENNVNAIRDLFDQGGTQLLNLVPFNKKTFMVAQKYLDHANGALHVGRKKLARKHLWSSLKNSKGQFLWMDYLKFSVRYVLAFFK